MNKRPLISTTLNLLKQIPKFALAGLGLITLYLGAFCLYLYPQLPDVEALATPEYHSTVSPVSFEDLPDELVQALVSAEDKNFFTHGGVDYSAILRALALFANNGAPTSGASTLTMQVAKNMFLNHEKSLGRKLSEFMLARQIEARFDKSEILEIYVNAIYFGNNTYGIEAATRLYFNKPVAQLSLPEAATLAGMPKAPSVFNPIASAERATKRRNWVLERMLDNAFITPVQFEQASASTIADTSAI